MYEIVYEVLRHLDEIIGAEVGQQVKMVDPPCVSLGSSSFWEQRWLGRDSVTCADD